MKTPTKGKTLAKILGCIFVSLGIICNEWLLTRLFSVDGAINLQNRVFIWLFDLSSITLGMVLWRAPHRITIVNNIVTHSTIMTGTIVVTLVSLKWLPAPWIWISLAWFIVSLYFTCSARRSVVKAVWFNVCLVFLVYGGYEAYLWVSNVQSYIRYEYRMEGQYTIAHGILGYAPRKNSSVSVAKYYRDNLIYHVTYTIDPNGLRISPPHVATHEKKCVLFFGGSFMFGEGVNDEEAMPYLVGVKTDGRYRVYNFGYHGYGAHQMLAALQKGMVDAIQCEPQYAIYQALIGHIARSAGLESWDTFGPKYGIGDTGAVVFKGYFNDGKSRIGSAVMRELRKSVIVRRMMMANYDKYNDYDIRLFIGLVDSARNIVENRYAGSEFHVLLWDERANGNFRRVMEELAAKNIRVHLMSEIIEDIDETCIRRHSSRTRYGACINNGKYTLSDYDPHPNRMAHEIIAEYVVRNILKE